MTQPEARTTFKLAGGAAAGALFTLLLTSGPRIEAAQERVGAQLITCRDGRTPIRSLPFTINECGSYFLAGCLMGEAGEHGITIEADDVTLDLNGFSLIGVPSSLTGIRIGSAPKNITVFNGTIRDWDGIGISSTGDNARIFDLRVLDNAEGINARDGCLVRDCLVEGNDIHGITIGDNCHIVRNLVIGNGDVGIAATGMGSCIEGNVVIGNDRGIHMFDATPDVRALVVGNKAHGNTTADFSAGGLSGVGGERLDATGITGYNIVMDNPLANVSF